MVAFKLVKTRLGALKIRQTLKNRGLGGVFLKKTL